MPPKVDMPRYEIAKKDVEVFEDKKLGNGGFGQVFRGRWSGRDVAIKVLLCHLTGDVEEEFRKEIEVMLDLRSPQIINIYGAVLQGSTQAMVVELMPKGDLYHLLRNSKDLPWDIKYRIALDIAYGLKYLHDRSIIHRDLKSLNVLLDDRLNAKISDFGLAKVKTISTSTSSSQGSVGTLLWMAPELFGRKTITSTASDIYALGMTFYEMLTHKLPFEDDLDGRDPKSVLPGWLKDGERPDLLTGPEEFKHLIKGCWVQDPTKRLIVGQVVSRLEPIVHSVLHEPITESTPQYQMFSVGSSVPGLSGVSSSTPQYQMFSNDAERRDMEARIKSEKEAKAKQQDIDSLKAELERQRQDKESQDKAKLAVEEAKKAEMLKQTQLEEQQRKEAEAKAQHLLALVISGDQPEAEALLSKYPNQNLASILGTLTDHAGRTFQGTAFQCAVASLDWFMWKMLLDKDNISPQLAYSQLKDIENHPYSKEILINWQQMLQDYDTLIDNASCCCAGWTWANMDNWWVNHIGKRQHDCPMHVIQEFYNPGRPFSPTPDFEVSYTLVRDIPKRAAILRKLGSEFSLARGQYPVWGAETCRAGNELRASYDRHSLSTLLESRISQRAELVSSLTQRLPRPVPK